MKIDTNINKQISPQPVQVNKQSENKEPSDTVVLGNTISGSIGDNLIPAPNPTTYGINLPGSSETITYIDMNDPNLTGKAAPDTNTFVFMYDTGGRENVRNIQLKGSFNPETGEYDSNWNMGKGITMVDDGTQGDIKPNDGVYSTTVQFDKNSSVKDMQWYAVGDIYDKKGNKVKEGEILMGEGEPVKFNVDGPFKLQYYAPTMNHRLGLHKYGQDGISFMTWSPEMGKGDLQEYNLFVDVFDKDGKLHSSLPMLKDPITGDWTYVSNKGWKELEGMSYEYTARTKDGKPYMMTIGDKKTPLAFSDPRSRYLQGQQRGVERIFVDPILGIETGWYDDSGKGGCNYADNPQWGRFTVDNKEKAKKVELTLMDENGKQLTKQQLIDKLGLPKLIPYDQARPEDKRDVDTLNKWQVDTSAKVTQYQWSDSVHEDGTIDMKKVGDAWVSTVNNFDKLVGLKYEFKVYDENGKLIGDKDGDGKLSEIERRDTPFNDPYSNVITARPGAERKSLIKESSYTFKYDNAPRKTEDPKKYVIYEAHVGSFMGSKDNANPSSFKDMIDNLDYIEKLGANTIELMPFNEFGGKRDWGYTPDYYFAGAEAYGFDMPAKEAIERGIVTPEEAQGKENVWVHGTDAIKLFVDEAHKKGFNVYSDVVYNHTSGKADADNPQFLIDGDKQSFFKWWGQYNSQSPWGAKPAFNASGVKQFFTDNSSQQIEEFHCDGIRFDFVQVLHDTGSTGEKWEGMQTLRKLNRTIDIFNPKSTTIAEDFTHNWLVSADYSKSEWQGEGEWRMEKKGMGFNAVWNDSFHHRLMEALGNKTSMDALMGAITGHEGVATWDNAVVYSHSHDEVGNSGQWAARMAAQSRKDEEVLKPYPRAMARTAAAVTLTSPGLPMIFQGEEFIDNADYKHGITSTWGNDMKWLEFDMTPDKLDNLKKISSFEEPKRSNLIKRLPADEKDYVQRYIKMTPEQKTDAENLANKRGHFNCYKDLIKLRESSPAFDRGGHIGRVYSHNADRVMAYERKGGNDHFVVVCNMSDQDRGGYNANLPPGRWKEVFNTNSGAYGGSNIGNGGGEFDANQGILLPKGSTVILKRVS